LWQHGGAAAAREETEWRQEEDRARVVASARRREHQYPLASFDLYEDAQRCRRQVHEDRRHHRLRLATMAELPPLPTVVAPPTRATPVATTSSR
jgi:hypothetical protein